MVITAAFSRCCLTLGITRAPFNVREASCRGVGCMPLGGATRLRSLFVHNPRVVERPDSPDPLLLGEQYGLPVGERLTRGAFVAAKIAAHVCERDVGGNERWVFDALRTKLGVLVVSFMNSHVLP